MADGLIQVPPDSTGKKVDASSLDVGLNTVMRQRVVIGDNSATAGFAIVTGGALLVTGTINISAMPTVTVTGGVAISGTATVAGSVGATVTGLVGLTAGTAVIGDINAISRTVQVAIGTPFTLQGISTTVTVTVATPFILQGISTTVQVAIATPITVNGISQTATVVFAGGSGRNADGGTYSTGTTSVLPGGFIFFSASATTVADGRVAAARITAERGIHVNLRNNAGTEVGVAAAPISVKVENQSATVTVAGVVNLSATAAVILAAGTANFGTLNNISATVVTGLSYVIEKTSNSQVQVGDSANAAIRVNVVAGSAGGPSMIDNTTFSTGASNLAPSGFIFFSASSTAVTDGRVAAARITEFRALHANLRTNGGVALDDTANSALRVNVVAGSSGGVSQVDGTTFTSQAANFIPIGGIFDDAATDALSENDAGVVRMTGQRAFHVNLRDGAGAELGAASATGVFVRTATVVFAAGVTVNNISATVLAAVTGTVNISGTPSVVLAAGTAVFGTLNNISATVIVAGVVSLGAGTNNIGFINNISATVTVGIASFPIIDNTTYSTGVTTVAPAGFIFFSASATTVTDGRIAAGRITDARGQHVNLRNNAGAEVGIAAAPLSVKIENGSATLQVAVGTPFIIQGISTTVTVTVATPFTLQGISTTVQCVVRGAVAHDLSITIGDAPVICGFRANISAQTAVANGDATWGWADQKGRQVMVLNHPAIIPSASHGPKCVTCSTSVGVVLVAAPGAGQAIYVTMIACANGSATLTRADVFQASQTASCVVSLHMAASGGGFVMKYDPPIQVGSNTGLTCRVDPSVVEAIFNIHFYVGNK